MAAALLGAANAGHHGHAHDIFHLARRNESAICVPTCTTVYTTITGDFICILFAPLCYILKTNFSANTTNTGQPTPDAIPAQNSTSTTTTSLTSTLSLTQTTTKAAVPTPAPQTCETPGG